MFWWISGLFDKHRKAERKAIMYGPSHPLTPSFTTSTGILQEQNLQCPAPHPRSWLNHISESSRRRHEIYLLRQRKERRRRRRLVKLREYQRLRDMVPSIAKKPTVDKVTVIEEAIRYIDYLHGALLTRLRTKGQPRCLLGVDVDVNSLNLEDIKSLVYQRVEKKNQLKKQQRQQRRERETSSFCPVSVFERFRTVPSYLTGRPPLPKRS